VIDRQLTQLVRLVDDLLDVSRITRGKLQLRLERMLLAEAVQAAVEASSAAMTSRGHRLTVSLPDDPVVLEADQTRLAQVFLNLLNNAAKYTPHGGAIDLSAVVEGDRLHVRITDSGVGFDPESAERLFEMFVQADDAREMAQGGLGIGLTLVRQLVTMHQGEVVARSDGRGRGSEFRVTLPVVNGSAAAQPQQ